LLHKLAAHRRRIRGARVAEAGPRWAFYASVAACLALLIFKLAGVALPAAAAAGALAAVPAAVAIREWARAFSIRDCAIHPARLLGLDERLSSALESSGAMGTVLLADATGALSRAAMPPRRVPREGKLLAGSLVLLAVLFTIPSPGRSGAKGDPAFEAATAAEAAKLEALANVDVQFQEAAEALKQGRPEEALALLEDLRRKLAAKLLDGAGGAAAPTQALLDQATSSASAISAELARLGRRVHAPPAAVAQAKLERQKAVEQGIAAAASSSDPSVALRSAVSDGAPWHPRYDPVIRRYFGREP
ncbi:MAG: hypothetical protein HY293_22175, partial [Planctomycetes bacterium]|nr:hypothetical protein [Planctomycetota bacterium]